MNGRGILALDNNRLHKLNQLKSQTAFERLTNNDADYKIE